MDLSNEAAIQQQLDDLKLQIERQMNEVIEAAAPTPPPETDTDESPTDPSEDLELVDTLWILKAAFQETSSLIELEDMKAASQSLERLQAKIEAFNSTYPRTLLGIDISRRAAELRTRIRNYVSQKWNDVVAVTPDSVSFSKIDKGDDIAALYPDSNATIVAIGHLIDKLVELEVSEVKHDEGLVFVQGTPQDLAAFIKAVDTAATYLTEEPPQTLSQAIVRRYKSHLLNSMVRRSIPRLYPADVKEIPAFKQQLEGLRNLETHLAELGWTQSSELSAVASSFDEQWPSVRRGQFLARLRQLYKDASPLTEIEARRKLVKKPSGAPVDEWEWNDDDDDDLGEQDQSSNDGAVVELWREFTAELGTEHYEQFFTLYRAIVPTVYGKHSLWLHADTMAFIAHAGAAAEEALAPFAYLYLNNYVRNHASTLDADLLPQLFGPKQGKALSQLKIHIGNVAEEANTEGGPEMREMVIGQLVEQIAVYVVNSVEAMEDISDEDSSKLASMIAKLDSLAVFFKDVKLAVPSWYKMEMLGRILMGNLATIQEMHSQHLLADFSAQELEGLLRALFVDSPTRKALIREIYGSEQR